MVDINRIDPELLERVTALARERHVSPQSIVEDALKAFLPRTDRAAASARPPMPQATKLAGPRFSLEHASLGKLTEMMDEGLPLEKLR